METFGAAAHLTAMIVLPAMFFVGMSVIKQWAWKYFGKKMLVTMSLAFVASAFVWSLSIVLSVTQSSTDNPDTDGGAFTVLCIGLIVHWLMYEKAEEAIKALKEGTKSLSFSDIVEEALKR